MQKSSHEAAIPNPALAPFQVLVGNWSTVGSHPAIPGELHGRASFEWMEGGAFLMMRTEVDEPGVPTAVAVIGSDDAKKEFWMLYFDERGVSRQIQVELQNNVLRWWRNAPKFSQRYRLEISADGSRIDGVGELSEDDETWKPDLQMMYTRIR